MAEILIHDSEDYPDGSVEIKMNGKSDSFIVDLECFSNDKDVSSSKSKSRMNMQRSFSRKVGVTGSNEEQDSLLISSFSSSSSPIEIVGESSEIKSNERDDEQSMETKSYKWRRRNNNNNNKIVKRSNWFSDPKRVLLFFATLSSLGTILLIYFTISMRKSYENVVDI